MAGLIGSNTTLARPAGCSVVAESGGLSGRPLKPLARRALRRAYARLAGRIPLIGVGGLETAADLLERLRDGASLLQAYTGFIYGGPRWPSEVTLELSREVRKAGYRSIDEAVGDGNRPNALR